MTAHSLQKKKLANTIAKKLAFDFTELSATIVSNIILSLEKEELLGVLLGTYDFSHKFNNSSTRKGHPKLKNIEIPILTTTNYADHREAQKAVLLQRFTAFEAAARDRGISLKLPLKLFISLVIDRCFYCGTTPEQIVKNKGYTFKFSGIDRKDSSLGYSAGNCVACCHYCNSTKSAMPVAAFLELALKKVSTGTPQDIELYKHIVEYQSLKAGRLRKVHHRELEDLDTFLKTPAVTKDEADNVPVRSTSKRAMAFRNAVVGQEVSIEELTSVVDNL